MSTRHIEMIYTIGHSNHRLDKFMSLLKKYDIDVLVDVRSRPWSRWKQFVGEGLAASLRSEGIVYEWLGGELGARREEEGCYVEGVAVYEQVAELPRFHEGIERVMEMAQGGRRLALMCAEREPWDCHRAILVARELSGRGAVVSHVMGDGDLMSQAEIEVYLVNRMRSRHLFNVMDGYEEAVRVAYEARGLEIAYRKF
ncbi:hypothetical protein KS4_20490 [Poriferisphaera corsica]|uniref:DUF488 domain-containing protein n=1 Tax=Poriferisphaera corsica TaxID=2528020 RepID=A0A517YUR8_9BACT|nr:DUF488 domain-containing protein [Poriferisphaera corsica]QDU33989.1 hypothetical protein KS4_20490 [Poriferisphaera corsica]